MRLSETRLEKQLFDRVFACKISQPSCQMALTKKNYLFSNSLFFEATSWILSIRVSFSTERFFWSQYNEFCSAASEN